LLEAQRTDESCALGRRLRGPSCATQPVTQLIIQSSVLLFAWEVSAAASQNMACLSSRMHQGRQTRPERGAGELWVEVWVECAAAAPRMSCFGHTRQSSRCLFSCFTALLDSCGQRAEAQPPRHLPSERGIRGIGRAMLSRAVGWDCEELGAVPFSRGACRRPGWR